MLTFVLFCCAVHARAREGAGRRYVSNSVEIYRDCSLRSRGNETRDLRRGGIESKSFSNVFGVVRDETMEFRCILGTWRLATLHSLYKITIPLRHGSFQSKCASIFNRNHSASIKTWHFNKFWPNILRLIPEKAISITKIRVGNSLWIIMRKKENCIKHPLFTSLIPKWGRLELQLFLAVVISAYPTGVYWYRKNKWVRLIACRLLCSNGCLYIK